LTHSFVKRESEIDTEVERNPSCHKMLYGVFRARERTAELLICSLYSAFITLFTKHVDNANLQSNKKSYILYNVSS